MAAKAARSKSRRQRARRDVPRKGKVAKTADTLTPVQSMQSFFAAQSEGYAPAPAIEQTGSWRLVPISFRIWLRNYNTSIALFMLPLLVIVLGGIIIGNGRTDITRLMLGSTLIFLAVIWQLINIPASLYFQLQAAKGRTPEIRQCYRGGWRHALRLAGLTALTSVLVFGGLLMLIVPGVILIRRYILAPFYLIDANLGIREAMERSAADTKPVSLYVWSVYGVLLGVNFLLFISFGQIFQPYGPLIGAFLTSLLYFGPALRYKEVALRVKADIDADEPDVKL